MTDRYILALQTPIPCEDLHEWACWFEDADRHVGLTQIYDHKVSTVFLGLDHSFRDDAEPILFETMIFGEKYLDENEYQTRCSTWQQAEQMHKTACDIIYNHIIIEKVTTILNLTLWAFLMTSTAFGMMLVRFYL